jgi:tight adherence protein B
MTAALSGILALALWLALAPSGGSGRRVRRILSSPSAGNPRELAAGRPGRWRALLPPRRRRGAAASEVPMTVVVQQLAALLKGGRTPVRLWAELWLLYGDRQPPVGPPDRPFWGAGRPNRGASPAEALSAASREILAAARAAALRGSPVAAAIRKAASPEPGKTAPRDRGRRERAVWVELAACFDVAEASGCPLADVLTRFAAHLEAEDDAEAARQSALAGPRATVRILTWLPFLGLGLGVLLGVDPPAILLGTPFGLAALGAGLALTAAGRIWSARLVRAAAGQQR